MQSDITPEGSVDASSSRRNFLAIATVGTASTLPAMANEQAAGKASTPALPLNQQLDACIEQLKTVLMRMHPVATEVGCTKPTKVSNPDGSFFLVMSGRIPSQPFEGRGTICSA